MTYEELLNLLKSLENQDNVEGMKRYGINPDNNLGISVKTIRNLAKDIGKNHVLALKLWDSGIRDARMLAASIDNPDEVTEKQMEKWAGEFNSWDVCDHVCGHLFDKTRFSYSKATEWAHRPEEFVKRAGFALMAWLAVHDKKAEDDKFIGFLNDILIEAADERNYVKKAVSWALRNIGKRNNMLHAKAVDTASRLRNTQYKASRWIANESLRELNSKKIIERLAKK